MFGNTIRNFPGQGNKKKMITLSPEVKSKLKAEKKTATKKPTKKPAKKAKPRSRSKQMKVCLPPMHVLVYFNKDEVCGYTVKTNIHDVAPIHQKEMMFLLPPNTPYKIWPLDFNVDGFDEAKWMLHPVGRLTEQLDSLAQQAMYKLALRYDVDLESSVNMSALNTSVMSENRLHLCYMYFRLEKEILPGMFLFQRLLERSFRPVKRTDFKRALAAVDKPLTDEEIESYKNILKDLGRLIITDEEYDEIEENYQTCGHESCECEKDEGGEECVCGNSPCDCPYP